MAANLFFFIARPDERKRDNVMAVSAPSYEQAARVVEEKNDYHSFKYRLAAKFSAKEIGDLIFTDGMDPLNTAAAIKYAIQEHMDLLTTTELVALGCAAKKIERQFLAGQGEVASNLAAAVEL